MGGSPSKCIQSLQFPYSSVNFWQGDAQSMFYPTLIGSAGRFDSASTDQSCNDGQGTYYEFSVTLVSSSLGAEYPCDNIKPDGDDGQAYPEPDSAFPLTCPSVSRNSLSAGNYYFRFTEVGSGEVVNGPNLAITKKDPIASCADSFSFPNRQDTFNYQTNDQGSDPLSVTYAYDEYQCANFYACSYFSQCSYTARLRAPGAAGAEYVMFYREALPGTDALASPYSASASTITTEFPAGTRGNIPAGGWTASMLLRDLRNPSLDETASYSFTVAHDAAMPQSSARGFKRRQDLGACPRGLQRCPIEGTDFTECVDTSTDIEHCGGCPGSADSVDCTAMSELDTVACVAGVCQAQSSTGAWRLLVQ